MSTKPKAIREAVLPLKLYMQLLRCDVQSVACSKDGASTISTMTYKGRDLRSRLILCVESDDVSLVHRCAALLLLQTGGHASFYPAPGRAVCGAVVSLPVDVRFVVEDC